MKLVQLGKKFAISSATWATNTWAFTTTAPHGFAVGDTFYLFDATSGQNVLITTAAGTTGSTITYTSATKDQVWALDFVKTQFPTGFTGTTDAYGNGLNELTVQATVTTTSGNGSGTVDIQVSNDGIAWKTIGTITIAAAASPATDLFTYAFVTQYIRANITSVVGTGGKMIITAAGERV